MAADAPTRTTHGWSSAASSSPGSSGSLALGLFYRDLKGISDAAKSSSDCTDLARVFGAEPDGVFLAAYHHFRHASPLTAGRHHVDLLEPGILGLPPLL
ncbi:hypothetical protein ET475_05220 [Microbacterium protaetiae]|uniref:Uncharacterized protein n=1 Tax=Microbacterium protaetiae TaxID=2509458 RepID=A0A4P6EBC1_9MICO|nr:hypothetical protein [Microbacterium protaetiae]QAY59452.1 hypothetical protein ET475_05220 [Microbacterium protaetiae]